MITAADCPHTTRTGTGSFVCKECFATEQARFRAAVEAADRAAEARLTEQARRRAEARPPKPPITPERRAELLAQREQRAARLAHVMELRDAGWTYAAIAADIGVSRERARQLVAKARYNP